MTVTCNTCKHYKLDFFNWLMHTPQFAKCARTKKTETVFDVVSGKTQTRTSIGYCSTERVDYRGHNNECGPQAIYWMPRKKEGLFTLMKRESA